MPVIDKLETLPTLLSQGQKLLGLDLGTKTIGLAVSDTGLQIATGLQTIKRRKFSMDAAVLDALIIREAIGGLVLGLPRNMDGSEGARAQSTRAFIRNYLARYQDKDTDTNTGTDKKAIQDMPVVLWDERLSTQAVSRTLLEADMSRAKRAKVVDKLAATYILQGYLDFLGNRPAPKVQP